MKKITFDIQFKNDPDYCVTPRVLDFQDLEHGNATLVSSCQKRTDVTDVKIINASSIKILFDYPLTNAATLTFESKDGFTFKDLFRCVFNGYSQIYAAESDPGTADEMLLNRATSEGPFGIWGHYIDDLFLECIEEDKPGEFSLGIGS